MSSEHDVPARLDRWQSVDFVRKIFETGTRADLDALTRTIWRRYGRGESAKVNAAALENLKARILERRVMLDRNDPR